MYEKVTQQQAIITAVLLPFYCITSLDDISMLLPLLLTLSHITVINAVACSRSGQIQLIQSGSITLGNAGRVEICMGGVWGTIAADSITTPWSEKNAQVACIQLGFSGALNAIFQRTIPVSELSMSPIHLSAVHCDGTENSILGCSHSASTQNFNHSYDAYIVCRPNGNSYSAIHPGGPQPGDIRLFGDTRNGHGAIQIYTITNGWQGICPDSSWTSSDAVTICQDLGYRHGSTGNPVDTPNGPGGQTSPRQLYDADCPNRPVTLANGIMTGVCSFRVQSSPGDCSVPEGRFAAVQCTAAIDRSVRLFGADDSRGGIVEIAFNGRWGILCDTDLSAVDAQSVCGGLGFGTDEAEVVPATSSKFTSILERESNLKPIWLDELSCTLTDLNLQACISEQNVIGFGNCQSASIAVIDCGYPTNGLSRGQVAGVVIGVMLTVGVSVYVCAQFEKLKRAKQAVANRVRGRHPPVPHSRTNDSHHETAAVEAAGPEPTVSQLLIPDPESPVSELVPSAPEQQQSSFLELLEPSAPALSKTPPPSFEEAGKYPTYSLELEPPPPYPGLPVSESQQYPINNPTYQPSNNY